MRTKESVLVTSQNSDWTTDGRQMDYFDDVFNTFLGLDSGIYLAVYGTVTNLSVLIQNILNCVVKTN